TKAGRHAIYLSEKLKGKGPAIYYTVNAGALKKINLVGHDGKIAAVPSKKISNYLLLTYGTSPSGNFIMKKNAVLVLDFDFIDEYGNSVTVNSPANYFSFRRVYDNGDIFPVTNQFLTFQVNQKDGHYQMVITALQMATYQIDKNSYMSEAIRFILVPGEVSPTLSYCTLNGPPALESGSLLYVTECTGGAEQKFKYNADGSIRNLAGELCADIRGCTRNDLQIIIYKCHVGQKGACRNQEWDLKPNGSLVTRMGTGKCLHVNGNIVTTHVCNNSANQKFVINNQDYTIKNGDKCFSPFNLLDSSLKTISSPPTLSLNEKVHYMCYLKDDYGNAITTKYFLQNSIYDFVCENQRLSPTSKTYKTEYTDKVTYSVSKYVTSETGKFEINGYLVKKGTTTRAKITPKINQFTVKGLANTYVLKNVLNLQNKNWVNINGAQINYVYDKGGLITAVDFAESDGLTLISSYGKYPPDFSISNVQAEIYNSHDNNFKFGGLTASIISIDGKQYVGIYANGKKPSDTVIKKSSFDYSIKITYKKGSTSEQKIITLKYNLNIGSYKTCFHNLDIGKTNLNIGSSLSFLVGENERKIATIELKTIDNYLYNYDIGKDKIQFLLEPSSSSITFRVAPLSIEGTYDIYAKPVSDYQGNLNIKINGQQKKKIPINSRREACYLEFQNPALFTHLKTNFKEHYYEYKGGFVNGSFDFLFKILDRNKKVIVKNDYFATYADIYSEQYGNDKTKFTVNYNQKSAAFEFKDNLPYANQKLTWVFFMRDSTCNNKYYIKYDGLKGGAPLDLNKSSYSLLNTKINIKEYAYVDVIYRDTVNLYYGLQKGKLEEMKKTTVVKGKRTDGKEVTFAFDSITKDYAIRYKYNFDLSGTYTVTATSGGKALKCNTKNSLEVIDNIYSLKHSKLKMILDTIIDMDPNVRATIDNTIQRPVYKLYFYSATGVKTTYTKDSVFTCKMTG
ncbi:MAG: ricin-type beta-trefoil lectin domain protein, partial [Clostridia bacterium]|nr:ricin-type beta-trefoil lectin domain protein [Clostridia bacterium]